MGFVLFFYFKFILKDTDKTGIEQCLNFQDEQTFVSLRNLQKTIKYHWFSINPTDKAQFIVIPILCGWWEKVKCSCRFVPIQ